MTQGRSAADEETSVYTVPVQPTEVPLGSPPAPPPPDFASGPPAAVVIPPAYPTYAPPVSRRASYGTTARVVFAGVVLLLYGIAEGIGGAVGAVAASSLRRLFDQLLRNAGLRIEASALTSVLTGFFVTMLIVGILQLLAALGVFAHRGWGRWLGAVLSGLGAALGAWLVYRVFAGAQTVSAATLLAPLAILVPYLLSLLALLFPGAHFRRGGRSN